jgi:hypothetical protein
LIKNLKPQIFFNIIIVEPSKITHGSNFTVKHTVKTTDFCCIQQEHSPMLETTAEAARILVWPPQLAKPKQQRNNISNEQYEQKVKELHKLKTKTESKLRTGQNLSFIGQCFSGFIVVLINHCLVSTIGFFLKK